MGASTTAHWPSWVRELAKLVFQEDRPDAAMDYPEPQWDVWMDRDVWPTLLVLPSLLLSHDPKSAHNAPYFNAAWCAANPGSHEARVMRAIVYAAVEGGLGYLKDQQDGPVYCVAPDDAVTWALGMSFTTPPGLVEAAKAKRQRIAAAKDLFSDDAAVVRAPQPTWADVPLPPVTDKPGIRRAFIIFVAQRCAGLTVPANKAGSMQLLGEHDSTVAKYTRDDAQFPKWYEPLREFAGKHPGGWGLVFEALGRMHPLAD